MTSQYVTYIDATSGVRVHKANDSSNFGQFNANGMQVYKGGAAVAQFGDTAILGQTGANKNYSYFSGSELMFVRNNSNSGYVSSDASALTVGRGSGDISFTSSGTQIDGPTLVNNKLSALAIGSDLFSTSSADVFASSAISGNSHKYGTTTVSKSKYYPLGIVGWNSPDTSAFVPSRLRLSAQSTGSATISYDIRNASGSSATGKFTADILWVRVTV